MTEWGVVGVIIALVGFGITVIKPIINLNTTIVKLTQIVETLGADVAELTSRNSKSHDRIFETLGRHETKLNDHETRLTVLEKEVKR